MHYKTIVLELLEERPALHERLRRSGQLMPTLDRYARNLRTSHIDWMDRLRRAQPCSAAPQIANEAMEHALQELLGRLRDASPPSEAEDLSLDRAMTFLRGHTPPE